VVGEVFLLLVCLEAVGEPAQPVCREELLCTGVEVRLDNDLGLDDLGNVAFADASGRVV
jgi:hypothetical protein